MRSKHGSWKEQVALFPIGQKDSRQEDREARPRKARTVPCQIASSVPGSTFGCEAKKKVTAALDARNVDDGADLEVRLTAHDCVGTNQTGSEPQSSYELWGYTVQFHAVLQAHPCAESPWRIRLAQDQMRL